MLTSPQSVTIGATAHSLSRINQDNFGGTYFKKGTGYEVKLTLKNSYEKAGVDGQFERHNADLTYTTFDVDNVPTVYQAYIVFRMKRGVDPVLPADVAQALCAWMTTNADAMAGWES